MRTDALAGGTILSGLETAWRSAAPDAPFRGEPVSAALDPYYSPSERRFTLFTLSAALAVLVGCIGLYGLAAFDTSRRRREIGIRKTLGASTREIISLFLLQFLRPVAWANVVAWPVAYIAGRAWLAGFDQRITLGAHYFVVTGMAAVVIAVATVIWQVAKMARADPAEALRYE